MTARRRAKGASVTQELSEAELAAQREATARKEQCAFEYTGAKEATKLARRLANASKGDVELKNRLASAERTERVAYGRTLDADDQQKRIRRFVINKFDAIRDAAGEFLESSSNGATITYMVFAYTKSVTGIVTQHSSILVPNMKDNLAKVRDVKDIAFSLLSNPDNFCKPDFDINMVHMDKQCSLLVSSGALDHLVKAYDPKDTSASIDVLRRSLAKGLKEFMPRPPLKPAPHVSPDAADVRFAEEQAAKAKRATGDGGEAADGVDGDGNGGSDPAAGPSAGGSEEGAPGAPDGPKGGGGGGSSSARAAKSTVGGGGGGKRGRPQPPSAEISAQPGGPSSAAESDRGLEGARQEAPQVPPASPLRKQPRTVGVLFFS